MAALTTQTVSPATKPASKPFPYKKVLVIGGTSGIGSALASQFVAAGIKVVVVGRRADRLSSFVAEHGSDNATAHVFDITKLSSIRDFITEVTAANPDLDCAFLNSGVYEILNFSDPDSLDMAAFENELTTNYTSFVHLTAALLPFLLAKEGQPTSLIYTTSALAFFPIQLLPTYSATKAALHHFILSLRRQLRWTDCRVIEIFPPIVYTDMVKGREEDYVKDLATMAMPLEEFAEATWAQLDAGKDQVAVGLSKVAFDGWEQERQQQFEDFNSLVGR
ncbi:short-chain dehydrogenase/ reductase-like protein [Macrophomina phaseolina]|uniref:Short-chain dehydrogenase/ reductase-like protein n=1 Tax=Macrophomina phaseolina TaxID=35725 RepID=A0ABQ8GTL4_9PEZI|nr:short-chain dehydrogenase/ reductase-like protein [Macrophomina phaseolina]